MTSMTSITRVGSKAKKSLRGWRGGGEYGYFRDLHIIDSPFSVQRFPSYAGDIILYKWG